MLKKATIGAWGVWLGVCEVREQQRVRKNLFGSRGPGGFSEGFVCMNSVFFFFF